MTHSEFMATLYGIAFLAAAAIYVYVYACAGPRTRSILLLGVPYLIFTTGRHAPGPGRSPSVDAVPLHVGATENSPTLVSEMMAVGAFADATPTEVLRALRADPTVQLSYTPVPPTLHVAVPMTHEPTHALDDEAQAILDRFDRHVRGWMSAPDYVQEWQQHVDAVHRDAGLFDEGHRRWRAGAWDVATGEMPRIRIPA
jgi:hypothetical protein